MAQSVGFLYMIVESLQSAVMWIFMSWKDISLVECLNVNLIVGWRLLMKSFMDWSCLVVPRKIGNLTSNESLPEGMTQMKGS